MKLRKRQAQTDDHALTALDHQAPLKLSAAEAEPSTQLRTRVLASFEQRIEYPNSVWRWLVPATAAMMASVLIALGYWGGWRLRLPEPPTPLPIVANKIPDLRPVAPAPHPQGEPARKHRVARPENQHSRPERFEANEQSKGTDLPVAQFDSLLYCDPFSCGDPMQVIRLEMPAASVGRAYRPLARNGFVNAELIVGTDGLTRAVRFTK